MDDKQICDEYEGPHIECWQCAGEGMVYSCFEEWACIDPEEGCFECGSICDICEGKGGWENPDDSSAAHESI